MTPLEKKLMKALEDLFQACADLSIDDMNRMDVVLHQASEALKEAGKAERAAMAASDRPWLT